LFQIKDKDPKQDMGAAAMFAPNMNMCFFPTFSDCHSNHRAATCTNNWVFWRLTQCNKMHLVSFTTNFNSAIVSSK